MKKYCLRYNAFVPLIWRKVKGSNQRMFIFLRAVFEFLQVSAKVTLEKNTQESLGTYKDLITFSNSLFCWHIFSSDVCKCVKNGGVDGRILKICKSCSRHVICMNYWSLTTERTSQRNWERKWIVLRWTRAARELNINVSLFFNLAFGDEFFSGKSRLKSSTNEILSSRPFSSGFCVQFRC